MVRSRSTRAVLTALLAAGCGIASAKEKLPALPGPAVVLIIRHAEKPDEKKNPDLAPRGFERAKALVKVFPSDRFPRPDVIIATKRSARSDRPLETVTPVAEALHLPVEHAIADDDYDELAKELRTDPKYAGKTVLIAWHHGKIPELARALGAKETPDKWKESVFDRVWKITYDHGEAKWQDLPEHALPGDSD